MESRRVETTEAQKRKKGDMDNWKKNIAKRSRNSGQEYVSVKTNKTVAARAVGEP